MSSYPFPLPIEQMMYRLYGKRFTVRDILEGLITSNIYIHEQIFLKKLIIRVLLLKHCSILYA